MREKTAIAGIGWTAFARGLGTSTKSLAAQASLNAVADAGLSVADIDGIVSFYWEKPDSPDPVEIAAALGIKNCNFSDFCSLGGTWSCGAVASAAMAVHADLCKHVLVYRAMNGYSNRAVREPRSPSGLDQFTLPYGEVHAAAKYGHYATAHMARFGTTSLDFAHLAVTQRDHAMLNKKAVMREPLTLEAHQSSRWVVYPYRLLDCCIQTDGAVALIVTTAERARDLKQAPVYIMSMLSGLTVSEHQWQTNGVRAAPALFNAAGITPADVDLAELYDPFTFMCMTHMEDFGLVPKGEVGAWVRANHNSLDGKCPVNTHGGLLSESYVQGLNHVIEAVQQLRPGGVRDDLCNGPHTFDRTICRQVRDAEIALCCGEEGGSSLLLRRA
jgi:17-hydroxy-3-oxo-4-pregnene-20-carboxyl-CoA lyase